MTWTRTGAMAAAWLCAGLLGCEGATLRPNARVEIEELTKSLAQDSDEDGVSDVIEHISKTDPDDAKSRPPPRGPPGTRKGAATCPMGWGAYATICILASENIWGGHDTLTYRGATTICRSIGDFYRVPIRVATHEDLDYIYSTVPHLAQRFDPKGKWLGNRVGDDKVLCGNRVIDRPWDGDIENFEGTCGKNGERAYWCVFDLHLYRP